MKVFLGGTVAGSTWREYMMPKLEIDYFNPVVDDPSGLSILLRPKNKKSVSLDCCHLSSFVCKVENKGEQSIVLVQFWKIMVYNYSSITEK